MLKLLRSRRGLLVVLSIFIFESLWIALSSRYPMAFDEYFHYGVAQLHTETLSPFLQSVPDSASLYGPITRDASFLYHYLLSFPLRILQLITDNMTWQILLLRMLNIAIAAASIVMYAKLLRKLGVSWVQTNTVLLFLILIPVVPLMAGQISYDNLFFLMVATVLLIGVSFFQRYQASKVIDAHLLNWLFIAGLFTCFVKYAFLPAMVAITLMVGVLVLRDRSDTKKAYALWWARSSRRNKILVAASVLVGLLLFSGSYGVNLARYHTPIPECDAVLSEKACEAYGPWFRDHKAKQVHTGSSASDIPPYVEQWFKQMMEETFFLIGAKYNDQGIVVYRGAEPLPLLLKAAWVLFTVGVIIALLGWRTVLARRDYQLIFGVFILYSIFLFGRNFGMFWGTGNPVAIHGRYLLPFIIPVIGIVALQASSIIGHRLTTNVKVGIFMVTLLIFLQGGLFTFIVSSTDDWMWPQSQPAIETNRAARNILQPFVYR